MTHTNTLAFVAALDNALSNGGFIKLTLKGYKGAEDALKSVDAKKVVVKRVQKESFTWHYKTRDIIKNFEIAEGVAQVRAWLSGDFTTASLWTAHGDWTLAIHGEIATLKQAPPSQTQVPSLDHDRAKSRLISAAGKPYLHALKITDEKGNVLKTAQDKFRQINRYVEILSPMLKALPKGSLEKIVDMGSGKGYLTFAIHDYVSSALNPYVRVTGALDRADLVALCNETAGRSGFAGLDFVQGSIEDYNSAGANVLIALHACDTATDDAIFKGITAGVELIAVAPCCHKQIRREMGAGKGAGDLDFLLKYGIFLERQAEMVTDGLRAMILEYCGYSTRVFEFISDAHTPKNVMIVATRKPDSKRDPALLEKIAAAKAYFGIKHHHLERVLDA